LRVPVSSALSVVRTGVSVFVDTGKSHDVEQAFGDEPWRRGIGAGVWLSAAAFRLAVSVAHGHQADTRVNFAAGFGF
jgi:hypothetical protein